MHLIFLPPGTIIHCTAGSLVFLQARKKAGKSESFVKARKSGVKVLFIHSTVKHCPILRICGFLNLSLNLKIN